MPLVSVILPNYNHSLFLKQRINSILEQTFQDFELIILDDSSTDNSAEIIQEYAKNAKISHIILNEDNSGSTFIQWQRGFAVAVGKYIWIAESDDYSDLTFLEKLVPQLERNIDNVLAFSCSYLVDENSNILPMDWDRTKEKAGRINNFEGKQFLCARMLTENSIYNAGMALFRKTALKGIDNHLSEFKYCGDWLFWNNICIQGNVIRYCEKLNYFRQHSNKITPKAESEGLRFLEGKFVIDKLFGELNLTKLQQNVIIGRFLKRIRNFEKYLNNDIRDAVFKDVCTFFCAQNWCLYIGIYELDKFFNFSALDLKENKYL